MELSRKLTPQWVDVKVGDESIGFLCAPLTQWQRLSVGTAPDVGASTWAAIRFGVRDWRGITEGGVPVPFSEKALELLFSSDDPNLTPAFVELARQITQRATLSETERKN